MMNISKISDAEFKDNGLAIEVLNESQLRVVAPRIFCEEPTNPMVSKRYTLASTATVINDMKSLGWEVVQAGQPSRRNSKSVSSYHMVTFQNKDIKITKTDETGKTVTECYPRIVLTNSHDGFNSFRFMVGLYRVVCSNGLIIATNTFNNIRIRHINYTFDELRHLVDDIVKMVPEQVEVLNKMQHTEINLEQKRALALAALRERRNDPELEVSEVVLDNILVPTRPEDEENNLWVTFNIIQEKMMNGGFMLPSKNGKSRQTRAIKAIHKTITLNQAMFKTAVSFIQ